MENSFVKRWEVTLDFCFSPLPSPLPLLFIYISAGPVFVLQILRLSETSFAWLFVPMITGIMVGSLAAGRVVHFWRPERTIRIGFFIMTCAAIANVLYAAFFTVAIPCSTTRKS